ncbi:hypothetical protein MKX01_030767 [Papaver californicum]|nr:hypothetical protein MKX01_030767 [Papaver californicum]
MQFVSFVVGPVLDIVSRLCELDQNLITLETSFNRLKSKRDDINGRIEREESNPAQPAKCTNEVMYWLQRVEAFETEVQKILEDNEAIMNGGGFFFYCWGRNNCWSAYRLERLVFQKQISFESLLREAGDFQNITYRCQPDPQQIPTDEVIGMDVKFKEVLDSLVTEGIIGLYGMGGVGKTTLLQKVNNEFAKNKHFDLVIFVVVSKDLNIKSIQNQIGEKLGISWREETEIYKRGSDIFKVLRNRKFFLLLDDIWEGIDLERMGVSKNALEITGSKIVFTTRNNQVCGDMEADKRIKIECLDEDQAWSLFQQKVKQEALSCHPDVTEVAKKVAKECRGLPLALITIGRTMSSKTDIRQWQHALHTLQGSASQFSGMADKVLAIMKFSYDNLENQKLKSCFLYCSLYPEDYPINLHDLIGVWIGEGFLDNVNGYAEARNEGHDVIRCLKDACLLETGIWVGVKMECLVKMHDIVRDLAIWISSDLGKKKKGTYLTLEAQSTLKLHEWEKAERISLINNRAIKELNGSPHCSNLITLLLRDSHISLISDDFFRFMPMLKVLHMYMYGVMLEKLPTSLFSLSKLQFLEMPKYHENNILTPGSLSSLSELKILCLSESCCHWEVEGGPSLDELESLQHLICLEITIGTGLALHRLVTSPKLQQCTTYLRIKYCPGITFLTFAPSSPSSSVSLFSLASMIRLEKLQLRHCDELDELRIMSWDEVSLFTTLDYFSLESMPKLRIVWDAPHQSFSSVNLNLVRIRGCPQIKDVTWLVYAQNLESLYLSQMDGLEEIISNEFATEEKLINTFSRLKILVLQHLRNLKRVCEPNLKFSLLEDIIVESCPELKKLPFNSNIGIPRTLMIQGEEEWWERLEWEDETTKSNLAPYFYIG